MDRKSRICQVQEHQIYGVTPKRRIEGRGGGGGGGNHSCIAGIRQQLTILGKLALK